VLGYQEEGKKTIDSIEVACPPMRVVDELAKRRFHALDDRGKIGIARPGLSMAIYTLLYHANLHEFLCAFPTSSSSLCGGS
jgi:hypothetical protein